MSLISVFFIILALSVAMSILSWIGLALWGEFAAKVFFVVGLWIAGLCANISFWGLVIIYTVKIVKKVWGA